MRHKEEDIALGPVQLARWVGSRPGFEGYWRQVQLGDDFSCRVALGANSSSVKLINTRTRWSGVRITGEVAVIAASLLPVFTG